MSDVFARGQGVDADDMSLSKMCTDQPMNEVNSVINKHIFTHETSDHFRGCETKC